MTEHQNNPEQPETDSGCGCGSAHDTRDGGCGCGSAQGDCGGRPCLPVPTFSTFILSLASSALVQLGEVPDPSTGKQEENIPLAKHTIDIISMFQDKIRNGLDAEETRLLEGLLYELRMKFVVKK